ncbi:hypothetical protein ACIRP3_30915 [Streptomyces sp. NPDC101209]|uniref:hypothetical protein n=1 Tax=Streptomyces sp. NPDC101209 TaxID=3366129 RepID=UPI0038251FC1
MVDTMAPLFNRAARTTRSAPHPRSAPLVDGSGPSAGPGLPADDEVLLDAPDDRLGPALVAAAHGEYAPAAALLAGTRARAEWEYRDRYAGRLSAFARARVEWLERWYADAPRDPDVLLLRAQLAVDRAWDSPARAELLREVSSLITAAARAADHDPVPWRIALDHARGAGAGHKYFGELWEAALRRAPHHYGCHVAALRYLATSWQGSYAECFDFADRAAQDAPAESLLQALPSRAALACLTGGAGPAVPPERLHAAADRAIAFSARFPAATPWPAEIRNKLTYVLVGLERWPDALGQLRLIGPYATSFPWDHLSDDPLALFLKVRSDVVGRCPAGSVPVPRDPRSERGGRAGSGDH